MNIASLRHTLTGQATMSADDPRLKSAAHEFEASLMQEFLKPLQEDPLFAPDNSSDSDGLGDLDGGSGDDQGSAGALMSFGSEAMAKAISERGGFGIATQILNHFRAGAKATHPATQSKN
jgi:Rod binding domain-containing protein